MHARSRTSAPEQLSGCPTSAQPALDLCISKNSMGVSQISHLVVGSTANFLSPKGLPVLCVEDHPYS